MNLRTFERCVKAAIVSAVLTVASQPALASHVFGYDAEINGTDLYTSTGVQTNPLFTIEQGDTLNFTLNMRGSPGTASVDLSGFSGVSPDPFTFTFDGTDGVEFSQLLTFNTIGSFSGTGRFTITGSPNYEFANGGQVTNPTFSFRVNVLAATPVPGPVAGAGLPALMALGGFMWARRRQAAAKA